VGNLSLLIDSILIGKCNFLRCYYRVRLEALMGKNIRAGW